MDHPLPCPSCGHTPTINTSHPYTTVACDDCYDGPGGRLGAGLDVTRAIADWNALVSEPGPHDTEVTDVGDMFDDATVTGGGW